MLAQHFWGQPPELVGRLVGWRAGLIRQDRKTRIEQHELIVFSQIAKHAFALVLKKTSTTDIIIDPQSDDWPSDTGRQSWPSLAIAFWTCDVCRYAGSASGRSEKVGIRAESRTLLGCHATRHGRWAVIELLGGLSELE